MRNCDFPNPPDTPPQKPLTPDQKKFADNALTRASELFDNERCKNFINALLQRAAASIGWPGYLSTDGYFAGIDGTRALNLYQQALANGSVSAQATVESRGTL